jgi:hypothetical protein
VDGVVSVTVTWPEAETVPIVKDWLVAVIEPVDVSPTAVTAPPKKPAPLTPMPPLAVMDPVEVDADTVESVTDTWPEDAIPTAVTKPPKKPAPLTPMPPLVLMDPVEVDVDGVASVTDTWPEAETAPMVKDWLAALIEPVDVNPTAVTAPPKKPAPLTPIPPSVVMEPVEVDVDTVISIDDTLPTAVKAPPK